MLIIRATTHCDLDQVERQARHCYGTRDGEVLVCAQSARLWFTWTGQRLTKAAAPVVQSIHVGA